jgi:citrate lyase subunit beta / citryl-CoA lyase
LPDLLRSYLFGPGSSDRILARILDAGADAVVLDLEDAVAPSRKDEARRKVATLIAERASDAPCQVHVRINRDGAGWSETDLRTVVAPGLTAVRLPKCEDADEVRRVDDVLAGLEDAAGMGTGSVGLYPALESARGLTIVAEVAAASRRVRRFTFGSADYVADLGARHLDNELGSYTRARLLVASRAAGIGAPVDGVHTDIEDLAGVEAAALQARDLGFSGKSVIHPKHVPVINRVFSPTADEVAWAQAIVDGSASAEARGIAATVVDGEFVDAAIVARAQGILARVASDRPEVTR